VSFTRQINGHAAVVTPFPTDRLRPLVGKSLGSLAIRLPSLSARPPNAEQENSEPAAKLAKKGQEILAFAGLRLRENERKEPDSRAGASTVAEHFRCADEPVAEDGRRLDHVSGRHSD
jgi:hypothetical protein